MFGKKKAENSLSQEIIDNKDLKTIQKKEKLLFSEEPLTKKELWLISFAAPTALCWDIFPPNSRNFPVNCISKRNSKEASSFFLELSNWLGIETELELLESVKQYLQKGSSVYLDFLLPVFQEYPVELWADKIKKLLPFSENQLKKLKKFQDTIFYIEKYNLTFPQKTVCAFDLSRAARLLVLGHAAGILQREKLFCFLEFIAFIACQSYENWSDYVSAYLVGIDLWQWGRKNFLKIAYSEIYEIQKVLLTSEKSPYSFLCLHSFPVKKVPAFEYFKKPIKLKKEDFEISIQIPFKIKATGDSLFGENYIKYENLLFPKRNTKPFECWLTAFGALSLGKEKIAVNGLVLLEESLKQKHILAYQKEFEISNKKSLIKEIEKRFIDGYAKSYDKLLPFLYEKTDKEQITSDKNTKELKQIKEALKSLLSYLNRYELKAPNEIETTYAFDLAIIAQIIIMGYEIGYLLRTEAIEYLKRVAWSANQYYSSWNYYMGAYLLGRGIWFCLKRQYNLIEQCKEEIRIARVLLSSKKSILFSNNIDEFLNLCNESYAIYKK